MAKDRVYPHLVKAASMGGDVISEGLRLDGLDNVGFEVVYTGTPTGTWAVECSNSATKEDGSDGNWISLTIETPPPNPAGAGSSFLLSLNQLPYRFVRLKYARTSGTGTLDVYASAKAL